MILQELSKLIEEKDEPIKDSAELLEKVTALDPALSLEQTLVTLETRIAAARRAIGLVNKLKDKGQRKKHFSAVTGNMNSIRGAMVRAMKQIDSFTRAERSYENRSDTDIREAVKAGDWVRTKSAHKQVAGVVSKIEDGVAHIRPHNNPEKVETVPVTHLVGEDRKN